MLDALVAEARLRWGLDPAAGSRSCRRDARRDADRAVAARARRAAGRAPRRGAGGDAARRAAARAGRPGGRDPLAVLRRLYPADHPVGRFGAATATTVGGLDRGRSRRPALPRPLTPERPPPDPGRCPGSRHRLRRPTAARGTASRPTRRCASTSSRRRTRSTTRSRPVRPRAGRRARRPVAAGRPARPAGGRGGRLRPGRRPGGDRAQDRPPPSPRLRRRRGADRDRRESPVGADQGRRAGRRRGGRRRR